jgi:hypothetical protein
LKAVREGAPSLDLSFIEILSGAEISMDLPVSTSGLNFAGSVIVIFLLLYPVLSLRRRPH